MFTEQPEDFWFREHIDHVFHEHRTLFNGQKSSIRTQANKQSCFLLHSHHLDILYNMDTSSANFTKRLCPRRLPYLVYIRLHKPRCFHSLCYDVNVHRWLSNSTLNHYHILHIALVFSKNKHSIPKLCCASTTTAQKY